MKLFTVALTLTLAAFAQQHPLTNADVVHAIEQGSSTEAVIQSIKTARTVDFRISPEYTPQLEKAGVPKEIIDAMIRRVMDDEARTSYSSGPEVTKPNPSKPPKVKRADTRPEPASTPRPPQTVPQPVAATPPTQTAPPPGPPDTAGATSAVEPGSTPASLPPSTRPAAQQPTSKPVTAAKSNDTLTVTSIPDGATVEWNRKVIGVTPLTYQAGEYAFNARKTTVFSKRLLQPVVLRVSKDGYGSRDVTITQQMSWRSLNGKFAGTFFIITSNSFDINLDKISAATAALTNADIIKLKAAGFSDELIIDKINNNPAAFHLELDDMVELHKVGISDAIIQAMMHAK